MSHKLSLGLKMMMGYIVVLLFQVVCALLVTQADEAACDTNDNDETEIQSIVPLLICQFFILSEPIADPTEVINLIIDEFSIAGLRTYPINYHGAKSLTESPHFDLMRPTAIYIHGFINSPTDYSAQSVIAAYEVHGGYNILALDSNKLIGMLYFRSSIMVKYIGAALAVFLYNLTENGVNIQDIHLVGHSLGAHIAGFTGKTFKEITSDSKLARITGLDPAGPCFSDTGIDDRLDKEDAEFVDIIHTNSGLFGIEETIGHADFFVNAGTNQPGCLWSGCSHNRAVMLYDESIIKNDSFIGAACASEEDFYSGNCNNNEKAVMGLGTPNNVRGTFYLWTAETSMYGRGIDGARY